MAQPVPINNSLKEVVTHVRYRQVVVTVVLEIWTSPGTYCAVACSLVSHTKATMKKTKTDFLSREIQSRGLVFSKSERENGAAL